jgi:multidrug resistance efflux pump
MSEPTTTTAERVRRTPAQIAQDRLDAAEASLAKAEARLKTAEDSIGALEAQVERAKKVVAHAANHPDLPAQPEDDGEFGTPESVR